MQTHSKRPRAAPLKIALLVTTLAAAYAPNAHADMFAFVTIHLVNGTSTDISTYNDLVTQELGNMGITAPAGYTLESCAMVSTANVNLIDNCGGVIDGGEVYNYFDDNELASSFSGFLSGPFMNPVTQIDGGAARQYWTGSTSAGVTSANPLGVPLSSSVTYGVSFANLDDPLDQGTNRASSLNSVLGLIDFIPTPEPSTHGTAAIGCIGIVLLLGYKHLKARGGGYPSRQSSNLRNDAPHPGLASASPHAGSPESRRPSSTELA